MKLFINSIKALISLRRQFPGYPKATQHIYSLIALILASDEQEDFCLPYLHNFML
jgi:hypothetical protein